MQDLRFFHSFLTAAYPSFPLERERVWILDVPILAQQVRESLVQGDHEGCELADQ